MPRFPIFLFFLPVVFLLSFNAPQYVDKPVYGGIFRMNFTEDFYSLYPPAVVDNASRRISEEIYEGLVKCDPSTLEIYPSLAEKWEINGDGTEYTFHLRTNVYFHDDPCFENGKGRKLVAGDVKFCFQNLLHTSPDNLGYVNTFKGIIDNENAFKAVDDSTFVIHLNKPCPQLTDILTLPACFIFPPEARKKYNDDMRIHAVGTGPFRVRMIREGETVVLEKNPSYWRTDNRGNKLPFLDAIKITFIKDKRSELTAFKEHELDLLNNPGMDALADIVQAGLDSFTTKQPEFQLLSDSALSFSFYGFLTTKPPFNNVKVRQAFSYAVDRKKIVDFVLQGNAIPVKNGFIPPGIPGYTNTNVSYEFDPDKARKLLREAGYPNGKGFPEITLQVNNGGGERNVSVADAIVNMLKENLNIDVKIEMLPFVQHLENIGAGKVLFWRYGWIADYADPSVFLNLAYGKNIPADSATSSYLNSSRFRNAEFDAAFEKGNSEMDKEMRMDDYRQAETIAMQQAFILPLYFETETQLIGSNIRNYHLNALDIRDLSEVYFSK